MYASEQDVRGLCNKIDSKQITPEEIIGFISKAEARVDAVLQTRYKLPLPSPVPQIIVSITSDFAASFLIDKYYGDLTRSKEQTPMAEVYFKRAEKDLENIVLNGLLDRYEGIRVLNKPNQNQVPFMKKNKRGASEMEEALRKW